MVFFRVKKDTEQIICINRGTSVFYYLLPYVGIKFSKIKILIKNKIK